MKSIWNRDIFQKLQTRAIEQVSVSTSFLSEEHVWSTVSSSYLRLWIYQSWLSERLKLREGHPWLTCLFVLLSLICWEVVLVSVKSLFRVQLRAGFTSREFILNRISSSFCYTFTCGYDELFQSNRPQLCNREAVCAGFESTCAMAECIIQIWVVSK